jgi:ubiquinone/menaquinone biosynthesis C-methylase UbiE
MERSGISSKPLDEDQLMREQMEKMVPSYDSYMRMMTFGRERLLREETVRLAKVAPGDSVLDVGCGTGTLTLAAKHQAGPAGNVFGMDAISGMIEASRRKAAQANADITFQLGTIDSIPCPDNRVDVAMSSFMIFHMSESTLRKGITEVYRVLKPQGRWLILDLALPAQPLQRFFAQKLFGWMLQHDLQELRPLMEAAGFSGVEVGQAKFRVMGLPMLGFVRGCAEKKDRSTSAA